MTFQQFYLIIRSRFRAVAIIFVATVSIVMAITLIMPKQYSATTAVVIDVKSPDLVTGSLLQGMVSPTYMSTQVDIIQSTRTSQKVVELLGLNQNPKIIESWLLETEGQGDITEWVAKSISEGLMVLPSSESSVIRIQYNDSDPRAAAAFANAYANAYLDVNLELKVEPARQFRKFFEKHSLEARDKLEASQKSLSDYMLKNGITSLDNRVDIEMSKLKDISSQLTAIQGIMTESQSKKQSTSDQTIAEVIQNPLINELKSQVARLQGKLTEAKTTLGFKHPQTTSISAELNALKEQLKSETDKVIESIQTSYEVTKQREFFLKEALEDQKLRVLKLNQQRDEILILQRDIESAQRTYDALNQRETQTSLESQASLTNVSILTPATVPTRHAKPNVIINLFLSAFLGTLFGIGIALMMELLNRRVRSAEDFSSLNIPVLGTVISAKGTIKNIQNGVG